MLMWNGSRRGNGTETSLTGKLQASALLYDIQGSDEETKRVYILFHSSNLLVIA